MADKEFPTKSIRDYKFGKPGGEKSISDRIDEAIEEKGQGFHVDSLAIFLGQKGSELSDDQMKQVDKRLVEVRDPKTAEDKDARGRARRIGGLMFKDNKRELKKELEDLGEVEFTALAILGSGAMLDNLDKMVTRGSGGPGNEGEGGFQTLGYGALIFGEQVRETAPALSIGTREGLPSAEVVTRAEVRRRQSYAITRILSSGKQYVSPLVQALKNSKQYRTNLPTNAGLQFEVFGKIPSTGEKLDRVVSPGKEHTQSLLENAPRGKDLRASLSGSKVLTEAHMKKGGKSEKIEIGLSTAGALDWVCGNRLIDYDRGKNKKYNKEDIIFIVDGKEVALWDISADEWKKIHSGRLSAEPKMNLDPRDPVNIVPGETIYADDSWSREDNGFSGYGKRVLNKNGIDVDKDDDMAALEKFADPLGFVFVEEPLSGENSLPLAGADLTDADRGRQKVVDELGYEFSFVGGHARALVTIFSRVGFFDFFNTKDQVRRAIKLTMQRFGYDENFDIGDLDMRDFMKHLYSEFFGKNKKWHPLVEAFAGGGRDLNPMLDWYDGEVNSERKKERKLGGVEFEGDITGKIKLEDGSTKTVKTSFSEEKSLKKLVKKLERKQRAGLLGEGELGELESAKDKLTVIGKEKEAAEEVFVRWFFGKKSYRADQSDAVVAQTIIETARAKSMKGESWEAIEPKLDSYYEAAVNAEREKRPEVYYAMSGSEATARILGATQAEIVQASCVNLRKTILSLVDTFEQPEVRGKDGKIVTDKDGKPVLEYNKSELYKFYKSLPDEAFKGKTGALLFAEIFSFEQYNVEAHEEAAEKQIRYLMDLADSLGAAAAFKDELIQALDPRLLQDQGIDDPGKTYKPEGAVTAFAQEVGGMAIELATGKKIMLSSVIANFLQGAAEKGVAFVKSQKWLGGVPSRLATRSDWLYAHRIVSQGLEYHYAREGLGVVGDTREPIELYPRADLAEIVNEGKQDDLDLDVDDIDVENKLVRYLRGKGFAVYINGKDKNALVGSEARDPLFKLSGMVNEDGVFTITKPEHFINDEGRVFFDPGKKYGTKDVNAFSVAVLVQMLEMAGRDAAVLSIEDRAWLFEQVGIKNVEYLSPKEWETAVKTGQSGESGEPGN